MLAVFEMTSLAGHSGLIQNTIHNIFNCSMSHASALNHNMSST